MPIGTNGVQETQVLISCTGTFQQIRVRFRVGSKFGFGSGSVEIHVDDEMKMLKLH